MNKRVVSVFAFAVLVAAAATLLFYRLVAGRLLASAKAPSAQIVVATRNLPIGTLLHETDVKTTDWTGPVPAQSAAKPEEVLNRGVIAPIYEGEPILASRLAPQGAGAGLAAVIPEGMRAVAVRVNDIVGVAGFVVPGMRVDVLIFGQPPNGDPSLGTRTKTILQNMEVLSAGQNIQKDAEGKPVSVSVVNLLTTPEQAEILSLASNDARIQLVLRNPLDTKEAKTPGTAIANLFAGAPLKAIQATAGSGKRRALPVRTVAVAAPPKPAPPPPIVIEVFHGAQKAEAKFAAEPDEKR